MNTFLLIKTDVMFWNYELSYIYYMCTYINLHIFLEVTYFLFKKKKIQSLCLAYYIDPMRGLHISTLKLKSKKKKKKKKKNPNKLVNFGPMT